MLLCDQNRMLHLLHKKGVQRFYIKKIMEDLRQSGVFNDPEMDDDDYSWNLLDRKADIWFNEELSPEEKMDAISNINIELQSQSQQIKAQNLFVTEHRIQKKILEMQESGAVPLDELSDKNEDSSFIRFGRTPCHEAVAMRNLKLVEKYAKRGLYLDCLDNNGHTPMEMAYYEGYKEALVIFEACIK